MRKHPNFKVCLCDSKDGTAVNADSLAMLPKGRQQM
jgi:hypothetical protein